MFNILCITVVNERNRTGIYREIARWKRGGKEEKLRKEVEGKVIGIKSKCHIKGRNSFPTEFITGLGVCFNFKSIHQQSIE